MRIVFDTNVFIAAYVTRGQCHDLVEHCFRAHEVFSSDVLLAELEAKLTRKLKFRSDTVAELLALLRSRIEVLDPPPLRPPACRDPDDDWVLATAVAGNCRCIVTGDQDLLVLHPFGSISIIRPSDFWRLESSM